MRPPRIGAIDANNLAAVVADAGGGMLRARSLDALADYAVAAGYAELLIHPSAHDGLGLPAALPLRAPGDLARNGEPHPFTTPGRFRFHPPGLSHWIIARDAAGVRLDVALPGYDAGSPFAAARDAGELRAAATAFAGAVGISYRHTPGSTGAALLRAVHSGPGGRRLEPPGAMPGPAATPGTERDFAWWRPPNAGERAMPFVHAYDVNGNYLAACSSIELGVGEVEEHGDGRPLALDGRLPGYWLCHLRPGDPGMPDPLDPAGRGDGGPVWLTTPSAVLAVELDRLERVERAHVWPARSRVLAPWYERLRDARVDLTVRGAGARPGPATAIALAAVKLTTNLTIGQLAAHFRAEGDELRRPDWRHHVIARARANLYRHLAAAARPANRRRPIAVDVDTAYYPSDDPDPGADPPVPVNPGLGRFKIAGTFPMADALDCPWEARTGPLRAFRDLTGGNG